MVNQSANLQDFLILGPCCAVLLFVLLAVGAVLLVLNRMGPPSQNQ